MKKLITLFIAVLACTLQLCAYADNALGQSIQIYTRFNKVLGTPQWLIMVRDIDNNQMIPYLYDIRKGDNFWLAFTFGRNYLITASNLKFNPYHYKTNNFCNLESNGQIIRGQSLYITITGDLYPNTDRYTCSVMKYADSNFTIVTPKTSEQ